MFTRIINLVGRAVGRLLSLRPARPVENAMRLEWDRRAQENARCYIATDAWQTDDAFRQSGEEDTQAILLDIQDMVRPEMAVVEIGCGTGRLLRALARRFKAVYGLDVSPEMIRVAQKELKDLNNLTLFVTSGRDLGCLNSETVDLVISYIVFQHIPDRATIENYIREAHRVVVPGGLFKFQVHGRGGTLLDAVREKVRRKTTWKGVRFTEAEIQSLTKGAGFDLLGTYFGASIQDLWAVAVKPAPASGSEIPEA